MSPASGVPGFGPAQLLRGAALTSAIGLLGGLLILAQLGPSLWGLVVPLALVCMFVGLVAAIGARTLAVGGTEGLLVGAAGALGVSAGLLLVVAPGVTSTVVLLIFASMVMLWSVIDLVIVSQGINDRRWRYWWWLHAVIGFAAAVWCVLRQPGTSAELAHVVGGYLAVNGLLGAALVGAFWDAQEPAA